MRELKIIEHISLDGVISSGAVAADRYIRGLRPVSRNEGRTADYYQAKLARYDSLSHVTIEIHR